MGNNDQNLIPLNERDKEEAKKIQQMGADATKKSFAKKKLLKR